MKEVLNSFLNRCEGSMPWVQALPKFSTPRGKRIAFFVHCFFPEHFHGTETYTLKLAQNIHAFGFEPVIVTAATEGEPTRDSLLTFYEYDGLPVICIDKNHMPNSGLLDTYYQAALKEVFFALLLHIKADLIHVTHLANHTGVLLAACRELGIPVVATFTDFFALCLNGKLQAADGSLCPGPNKWRSNCLRCLYGEYKLRGEVPSLQLDYDQMMHLPGMSVALRLAMGRMTREQAEKYADLFAVVQRPDILAECYSEVRAAIVPTAFTRKIYENNGPRIPLHHIAFGVDLPASSYREQKKTGPVKLGYIGQLSYHKGVDLLLEAVRRLPVEEFSLDIYGLETQAPGYARKLRQLAEGHPIQFCGVFPPEELGEILGSLDYLVIPSRWYENSPLILLSSLAYHIPVIISDAEGMTEFVQAGVNGYIFEMDNVDSLTRVLEHALQNATLAFELKSRTTYLRDWSAMVGETAAIYANIFQSHMK